MGCDVEATQWHSIGHVGTTMVPNLRSLASLFSLKKQTVATSSNMFRSYLRISDFHGVFKTRGATMVIEGVDPARGNQPMMPGSYVDDLQCGHSRAAPPTGSSWLSSANEGDGGWRVETCWTMLNVASLMGFGWFWVIFVLHGVEFWKSLEKEMWQAICFLTLRMPIKMLGWNFCLLCDCCFSGFFANC